MATLQIVQVKSANGTNAAQRGTLRSLGLRGIGSTTARPDNPALRGMIRAVGHLVEVSDKEGSKEDRDG
jgi:large subunit ribosomal protein L30